MSGTDGPRQVDEDYQDDIDYIVQAFTPQRGCTCKCCMEKKL